MRFGWCVIRVTFWVWTVSDEISTFVDWCSPLMKWRDKDEHGFGYGSRNFVIGGVVALAEISTRFDEALRGKEACRWGCMWCCRRFPVWFRWSAALVSGVGEGDRVWRHVFFSLLRSQHVFLTCVFWLGTWTFGVLGFLLGSIFSFWCNVVLGFVLWSWFL